MKHFQNFSHNRWTKIAIIKVSTVLSTVTVLTFMLNMRTSCYRINTFFLPHWSTFCLIFVTTQVLFILYISLAKINQYLSLGHDVFKAIGLNDRKYSLFTRRRASEDYKRGLQRQVSDEVQKNVRAKSENWLKSLSTSSRKFDLKASAWCFNRHYLDENSNYFLITLLLVSDCYWKFNSNPKARMSLFKLMVL